MGCSNCAFGNTTQIDKTNEELYISRGNHKLNAYDWLSDLPDTAHESDIVEIRFKNTRKEFFQNQNNLPIKRGDVVAVEAHSGHDIGTISLTGRIAEMQFKRKKIDVKKHPLRKIYRKATESDIQKWKEASAKEQQTMIRARQLANELGLEMKIGDVEFQGDKSRAIFYYIADGRVDFRELIKKYAREFNIRIEMRQIGARQEAALIGGFGSCGRELCCSTWRTDFKTITTQAARYQELSLNAQKLAGQCGKLKCCLMYELDSYLDARKDFPKELLELELKDGTAYSHKIDVLKRIVYYSMDKNRIVDYTAVGIDRIKEIILMNKKGEKPERLVEQVAVIKTIDTFQNAVGDGSIDRMIGNAPKKKRKKKRKFKNGQKEGNPQLKADSSKKEAQGSKGQGEGRKNTQGSKSRFKGNNRKRGNETKKGGETGKS